MDVEGEEEGEAGRSSSKATRRGKAKGPSRMDVEGEEERDAGRSPSKATRKGKAKGKAPAPKAKPNNNGGRRGMLTDSPADGPVDELALHHEFQKLLAAARDAKLVQFTP